MIIDIEDYDDTSSLDSEKPRAEEQLRDVLAKRTEGRNSFWLRLRGEEFPNLNVAFSGDYATVNYFAPRDAEPSDWVSKGGIEHLPAGGETTFYYNSVQEAQEMDNAVVVTAESAVQATIEFFRTPYSRPTAVEWYEL